MASQAGQTAAAVTTSTPTAPSSPPPQSGSPCLAALVLRLLRELLHGGQSCINALDRALLLRKERRSRSQRVRTRKEGASAKHQVVAVSSQLLPDSPVLRRCPVNVLVVRVLGGGHATPPPPSAGGGGEGVPRVPGQTVGSATTGDVVGRCECASDGDVVGDQQCVCVDPAPGVGELERGAAGDRVSDVAMARLGPAHGHVEADPELSEWTGSHLHVLQSESLVSRSATR